jgi:hypothetical protein
MLTDGSSSMVNCKTDPRDWRPLLVDRLTSIWPRSDDAQGNKTVCQRLAVTERHLDGRQPDEEARLPLRGRVSFNASRLFRRRLSSASDFRREDADRSRLLFSSDWLLACARLVQHHRNCQGLMQCEGWPIHWILA